MKKYSICTIVLAACLLAGGCVSSPNSAAGFKPFVLENVIPFDQGNPQNPRFEISMSLADPAKPDSGIGNLIRELLYEGQSAADYGNAVAAKLGKLYAEIHGEWESLGERPMDSFNWHYTEKAEGRTVSVKGLIPGHEKLLVLAKTTESYLGGAHGNSSTSCFVVDPAAAKQLVLDDIFNDTEKLRLLLEAELRRQYGLPENAPLSEAGFFEDRVELPENFFLTEKDASSMYFLWNAYEIAPYVMGAIQISLPFRSLSPLFRK
ncbi:MAG: RsiV family protein [Treponema sp.]|jgi:hypothetical protein|nr:RsiV family protein [Treponema sp.]